MPYPFRFAAMLLLFISCFACNNQEDSSKWIKEGYEGKHYQKLAVVCVNESKKVRKKFRKRIVKALKAKGIQAVSGKDIFPDGLTEADKDPEHLISRLNAQDVDGVLALFIVREKTMPVKKKKLKQEGVYWVGNFVYRRLTIDHEDDEDGGEEEEEPIEEAFVLEAVLHDVSPDLAEKKETLVWRDHSKINKDSTTKFAAQHFADSVAVQLVDVDRVIKLDK